MRKMLMVLLMASLLILVLSCGKKGVPPGDGDTPDKSLKLVSGNNQTGPACSNLPSPLTVRLRTNLGEPVIGDTVWFSQITPSDSGKIQWPYRVTDTGGYARTYFRLDAQVGVDTIQAFVKHATDSVVYFSVTTVAGQADSIIVISPQGLLAGIAGEALTDSLKVRVTDKYGNAIADDSVTFVTYYRSLVVTDTSQLLPFESDTAYTRSDVSGMATAVWILTVNPDPASGYPNFRPTMTVYNSRGDSIRFYARADDPGVLEYYDDIQPIFVENCFSCHPDPLHRTEYRLDFYYEIEAGGAMIPGDTTSRLLDSINPYLHLSNINTVEQDKVIRWVVTDNAAPGSSGLNNYHDQMKPIIDAACISCHSGPTPSGSYRMTTHLEIRGGGTDAIANAMAGDSLSLAVQRILSGGNMRQYFGADSVMLADSVVRWIVRDSLRDY